VGADGKNPTQCREANDVLGIDLIKSTREGERWLAEDWGREDLDSGLSRWKIFNHTVRREIRNSQRVERRRSRGARWGGTDLTPLLWVEKGLSLISAPWKRKRRKEGSGGASSRSEEAGGMTEQRAPAENQKPSRDSDIENVGKQKNVVLVFRGMKRFFVTRGRAFLVGGPRGQTSRWSAILGG